ncbi:MAG: prepilin-type N-terminal cleavage/methylation domain-containing protein [Deltaproteobacteria bacterium]|nr:prepilin-type N-terminal cleavage/methylation domain-containing protein [Deltaproteobacteria bacterium]
MGPKAIRRSTGWAGGVPRARVPAESGFTLVEIMVSLVIATILLGAIFYVYSISTGAYQVQEQLMRAMEQARFGLEELKRDIGAAGFLATPDSTADTNVCPKPVSRLQGIYFQRQGDVYEGLTNINIQPTAVVLLGAYASPEVFFTQQILNRVVTLQQTANFPQTQGEFDSIFNANRMLRIVNAEQYEMYYRIASWDFATRTVTLTTAPPVSSPPDYCGIQGFGVGLEVNVVNYIRYILRFDTRNGAPVDEAGRPNKVDLIREELDPSGTVVNGTRLVVAENIADLQFYDFINDVDATGRDPNLVISPYITNVLNPGGGGTLGLGVGARPQDLRFVTIVLTARTEDEDPNLVFTPRAGAFAPLLAYDSEKALRGASRTATLAARVDIKAFQVRNVK